MLKQHRAPPAARSIGTLASGPILPILIRLSLMNSVAMGATVAVSILETIYVGQLGVPALAGIAVVFPIAVMQHSFSNGAMGGGVASAISRALGAGDEDRARALVLHGLIIGLTLGLCFMAIMLPLGPSIYALLGAQEAALNEAIRFSNTLFLGAIAVWGTNTLLAIVRGTGNMKIPTATVLGISIAQVLIGGGLGLGLGPLPRLGMTGIALGQVVAFAMGGCFLLWFLMSGAARVSLSLRGIPLRRTIFADVLRVGGPSCIAPLQTNLTVLILTGLVAQFGTVALGGYGIGSRLEVLVVSIAFGVGVACVPMVGVAIGGGDVARARRVAWYGALLAASLLEIIGLGAAIAPAAWAGLFTADPQALANAELYLRWAGPAYGFFGAGLCLFFASQGSGKVLGTVLAGTLRLALIAFGGWMLAALSAPLWAYFALIALGMVVFGVAAAIAVRQTDWA